MVKIGLEIHQQLNTKKLFCSCDSITTDLVLMRFKRKLRASFGETGKIDVAALAEMKKDRVFIYEATENSCLVEADEEPPHPLNREALELALQIAILMHCKIFEEIYFMRKIVIDGSNTSGFQRTALIGKDGYLDTKHGRVTISSICLEEESARKIEDLGNRVVYRLDRLGIPLVEIATGPDMKEGEEVKEVAEEIGYLLRATKRVKRGLASIRQDLNISVDGERVEIKGVSQLKLIPKIVETEIKRQQMLNSLISELKVRNAESVDPEIVELTQIFENTGSKVIKTSFASGERVFGMVIPKFAGLLKSDKYRLGKELAEYIRVLGIRGLFHSDELPGYGVTESEVESVRTYLNLKKEDAFVIVAESEDKAKSALKSVIARINLAFNGVVGETRGPKDDGTSEYLRPLPGRERMYPETDIPPTPISKELIEKITANLPEQFGAKVARFSKQYKLSEQQAAQIIRGSLDDLFERLAKIYSHYSIIARTLLNTMPELEKEGVDTDHISEEILSNMFQKLAQGTFAKEAIPELLKMVILEKISMDQAVQKLGIELISKSEIENVVKKIIREKIEFVKEKRENSIGPLMGLVMAELKGKADGKLINEILVKEIALFLEKEL